MEAKIRPDKLDVLKLRKDENIEINDFCRYPRNSISSHKATAKKFRIAHNKIDSCTLKSKATKCKAKEMDIIKEINIKLIWNVLLKRPKDTINLSL